MVRFRKYLIIVITVIVVIFSSCSANRNIIDNLNEEPIEEIKMSKKDVLVYGMGMLIEFYTMKHLKSPTCAKDLILWIESMDKDSQLVYYLQYEYLKKKGKTLVFNTEAKTIDSELVLIISVYHKKAISRNGFIRAYVYFPLE